ncbi:MAG: hypothetical protein ACRYFY_18540, partial [Janthinobacterium lividum]
LERNRTRIDAPQDQPQLMAELLRRPWTKRSPFARIEGWLRDTDINGKVLSQRKAARLLERLSGQTPDGSDGVAGTRIIHLGDTLALDHVGDAKHRRHNGDDRVGRADLMESVPGT